MMMMLNYSATSESLLEIITACFSPDKINLLSWNSMFAQANEKAKELLTEQATFLR